MMMLQRRVRIHDPNDVVSEAPTGADDNTPAENASAKIDTTTNVGHGVGVEGEVEEQIPNVEVLGGIDGPPVDDCCPFCFDDFSVPCKANNCRHWFCGSCFVKYWEYSSLYRPCKCPMCLSKITELIPQASLYNQQDDEVAKVLEDVQNYNLRFVRSARGLIWRVHECFSRMFRRIMDPGNGLELLFEVRIFAMILGLLVYMVASPFNFISPGDVSIIHVFDYAAMITCICLRMYGHYRRRLVQRAQNLAAAQVRSLSDPN